MKFLNKYKGGLLIMATSYSAMAKLYGLKLYHGDITENRIPACHRNQAKAYAEYLKSLDK